MHQQQQMLRVEALRKFFFLQLVPALALDATILMLEIKIPHQKALDFRQYLIIFPQKKQELITGGRGSNVYLTEEDKKKKRST